MKEKRVWIGLAVLFAIIGVPQLFWKPSRFGGIFLLAHAGLGDAGVPAKTPYPGQWMAVRCREYCSIMGLMFTGRW